MSTGGEAVAELICGAWIELRDSLSGPGPSTFRRADCDRAEPLIALEEDGALDPDSNEAGWLGEHLMRCRACRAARDAIQDAAETYRAWRPMAAGPTLFRETMTSAAELVGADWSKAIARHESQRAAVLSHRLRDLTAIALAACLLLLVVLARTLSNDDPVRSVEPAVEKPAAEQRAVEEPATQGPDAAATPPRKARRRVAVGPAVARPRGKAPRTTAKKGVRPQRLERRPERRPQRRDVAAPEPDRQRQEAPRQAEIEREPAQDAPDSLVPEPAPSPTPTP